MNKSELISKLRTLPQQIDNLTKDLSEADLTTVYMFKDDGSPEWTVAQNVHHLADAHMNSYIRCKLVLSEDEPTVKPFDHDRWANQPDAKSADVSYSIAILHSVHTRWALMFENLSEDEWTRIGHHPESGPFSIAHQLKYYAEHGEWHIDQIQRTLAAKN